MAKMKCCPACGCKAVVQTYYTGLGRFYAAYCINMFCKQRTKKYRKRADAIKAWNSEEYLVEDHVKQL